jgi:CRP-like cAMP-binding protein/CheY-like chemotaxis protein
MKKIAVIEDNNEMRENIEEILALADYEVVTAANGKLGVELVKKELPDLIVCDIMMPELDGYGVLYYLSKTPDTSAIPFIFLTAKTERSDMRKGMNMGADDYISKPFDEMELLSAIESRLKKRSRFQEVLEVPENKWSSFQDVVLDLGGLDFLKDKAPTQSYDKKDVVYGEGEIPKYLFYVESGRVRVYKSNEDAKEMATAVYGPGDFFGYSELLSQDHYTETAVTLDGAKLALIPKSDFEDLIFQNKDISINFIKLLAGNVVERESKLVNLAYNTVRKRVATALAELYDKFQVRQEDYVEVRITRDELASMVGTATESVIRILSEFKTDGYIKAKGSLITVMDIDGLRNYRF